MKKKQALILILTLILFNIYCKKETPSGKVGFRFVPIELENRLLTHPNSGLNMDGENLSFFCSKNTFVWKAEQKFNYNIIDQSFTSKPFKNTDTSVIVSVTPIGAGKYLVILIDYRFYSIINGNILYRKKVGLMDENGTISKEFIVSGFPYEFSNSCKLTNGNYCASFTYTTGSSTTSSMYFWDSNLNLIQIKNINERVLYNYADALACIDQKIIVLFRAVTLNDSVIISEYDLNGGKLKTNSISIPLQGYFQVLPAQNGYKVFGSFINSTNYEKFMMVSFDASGNLQSKKFLTNNDFALINEFVNFNSDQDYDISNIIFHDNKYYFTLLLYDRSGNKSKTKNKFVRINDAFEIEKLQVLETANFNEKTYRYLSLYGAHFVSLSPSNWAGIQGLSIVETDEDGNVLK